MDYFKCFQDSVNELKEIREYESLNTLSKAIGIHQTTLSKWLTGKCYPTLNYAVNLNSTVEEKEWGAEDKDF